MSIQQEISAFVVQLSQALIDQNIYFEAHYWGTFEIKKALLTVDRSTSFVFASSHFHPFDQQILCIPQSENFILSRPGEEDISIASSLTEFLGTPQNFKDHLSKADFHFDYRLNFDQLLRPDSFLISEINDPEHFEEIEAYYELIQLFGTLTGWHFDQIKGVQKGAIKKLSLQKDNQHWEIELNKELFDNEIISQLNRILIDRGIEEYILSSSINKDMRMVLLKLTAGEQEKLQRMGLLV